MSKFLKIPYGNYTIEVQESGEIRLDTGENQGVVRITGDLVVDGNTTTSINSTDTDIKDNIIVLNKGETGDGITKGQSGIQIDRGNETDVSFVFDENINEVLDPYNKVRVSGAFSFYKDALSNNLVGIRTNSVTTDDSSDLVLLGQSTRKIVVDPGEGGSPYSERLDDDNDIPNKKYVDDKILASLGQEQLIRSFDTVVQVYDFEENGFPSNIDFRVDDVTVANMDSTTMRLYDLVINGSAIETENQDDSIVLTATGSGTIQINSILEITKTTTDPDTPVDGVKIYSKDEAEGGTGIFYTNESGTRDELISRNRALLYSMVI